MPRPDLPDDPDECATAKAQLIADAVTVPWTFQVGDVEVVVSAVEVDGKVLRFRVAATRDGAPLDLLDGVFEYVNPNVLVPDPAGDVDTGGVLWRCDPGAVAEAIIGDTVGGWL